MNNFGRSALVYFVLFFILLNIIILLIDSGNVTDTVDLSPIFNIKTIYILILIVLPIMGIIFLRNKEDKPKEEITDEQYRKFNETYAKISSKYKYSIESQRKELKSKILKTNVRNTLLVLLFLIIGIFIELAVILMGIVVVFCLISYANILEARKQYIKSYKKNIIEGFIKVVDERLNYYSEEVRKADVLFPSYEHEVNQYEKTNRQQIKENLTKSQEYINLVELNDMLELIRYDDYISGIIGEDIKIDMANIMAEYKVMYSATRNFFYGILSVTKIDKNIKDSIFIKKKQILASKEKLQMDSYEFEKMFDVYSKDRNLATRILTSEIMQTIVDFSKKNNIELEIYIKDNNIYLLFNVGQMFEPKVYANTIKKKDLYKYYKILLFVVEMTSKINKEIREIDV